MADRNSAQRFNPRDPVHWIMAWIYGRITEDEMNQALRRLGVEP